VATARLTLTLRGRRTTVDEHRKRPVREASNEAEAARSALTD